MYAQIIVLCVLAIPLGIWLCHGPGWEALRALREWPSLLAPAILVWFGSILIAEIDAESLHQSLFTWKYKSVTFSPSVLTLLGMALHAIGAAFLFWLLSSRWAPRDRPPFLMVLVSASALLLAVWTLLFLALVPVLAIFLPLVKETHFLIVPLPAFAAFLVLNLIVAPTVGILPRTGGRPVQALVESLALLSRGGWRRWIATVTLHLLVGGGLTVIWLDDYTISHTERTVKGTRVTVETESRSFDTLDVTATTFCVLNLTFENEWLEDFYEEIEEPRPAHVHYLLGLLTALLSTVFITAYAQGSERHPLTGPPPATPQ